MKIRFLYFIIFLFLFFSCKKNDSTGIIIQQTQENIEEETPLMRGNRKMVTLENEEIDLLIKRYGWNMIKTGTGLRYEIMKQGIGDFCKVGDEVELTFTTQFLTGDTVYSSQSMGNKTFVLHKTEEIVALHEVMFFLKKGAKARLVIPSHLAYGISGDGYKIMGQHALIMHIELINKKSITKQ